MFITSAMEVMFLTGVFLFVYLFVCQDCTKTTELIGPNVVEGCTVGQGRTRWISRPIWIINSDFEFFFFSLKLSVCCLRLALAEVWVSLLVVFSGGFVQEMKTSDLLHMTRNPNCKQNILSQKSCRFHQDNCSTKGATSLLCFIEIPQPTAK